VIVLGESESTSRVCELLKISRSAYYAWQHGALSQTGQQDKEITPLIRALFWKNRRRYGARRLASDLADLGICCSRRRVRRIMIEQGLRAIQPKSFVPKTTNSHHHLGYSPNLLLEAQNPGKINELWVGDITYVPLRGGEFCYLALLMDRFSRWLVGWSLDDTMTDSLVISVIRKAIRARQPPVGLIHHTDRGGQYASRRYRELLRRAGMRQSMNRPDNCYDNAFMESCFGTIKTELEMTEYDNHRAARRQIAEFIAYYQHDRKHSSLGNLTPQQFERLQHPSPAGSSDPPRSSEG
jgi:putative transposase